MIRLFCRAATPRVGTATARYCTVLYCKYLLVSICKSRASTPDGGGCIDVLIIDVAVETRES